MLAVLTFGVLTAGTTKANPLSFSNVSVFQISSKVDLFSNPGAKIVGPQLSFSVDIAGVLPAGASDTLRITYNELGSPANIQDFQIPIFGTVQPPFTLFFSVLSPGANLQGIPATLTVDLLNSAPDFVIPSGPNQGQAVDSYTYAFNVARPVPEPATLLALVSGLAALGVRLRRRD
jgi:hypothetical protein